MTLAILFKSHVKGYTRGDGVAVRPHEDKRTHKPSKLFGAVIGAAKRAYSGLSFDAQRAVESWNVNWTTCKLERAFEDNDDVAKEIDAAFEPVRDALRRLHGGDTITLYRGEKNREEVSPDSRMLFSWSPVQSVSERFAANAHKLISHSKITDDDIDAAVHQFDTTGFVSFRGKKYKRHKDATDTYDIYDRHNNIITDGDDIERGLRESRDYINELADDQANKGVIYRADVPIDSIVWIPLDYNLKDPEFIAKHNPRKQNQNSVMRTPKTIIFLKARIRGYTRKDGTFVAPHSDSRVAHVVAESRNKLQEVRNRKAAEEVGSKKHGFFSMLESTHEKSHAALETVANHFEKHGDGLQLKHHSKNEWAMLLPEASEQGKYRFQTYDESGFQSHSTHEDRGEAIKELSKRGYTEPDMDSLDRLAGSKKWSKGAEVLALVQAKNSGLISHEDAFKKRNEIEERYGDLSKSILFLKPKK